MGSQRSSITFRRITRNESHIFLGEDRVGDVTKQMDVMNPSGYIWVIHLSEDHRGPKILTDPHQIRSETQLLVDTHPLWA